MNKRQSYLKSSRTPILLRETSFDVLLLDAESRQSLVAVRSLGKKGLRIALIANYQKNAPAFHSRYCQLGITAPSAEGTKEYISFLLTFLEQHAITVIIPSSDGTIAVLRKYRKQIEKYTKIALGSEKALVNAVDKTKTLNIAKKLGITIPQSIVVSKRTDIIPALKKIKLPIVVKPVESWVESEKGTKRVCPELVTTQKGALDAFDRLTEYGGSVLFQPYLTGKREAISLVYTNKKMYGVFAQYAKRTQPPIGGTSILRQSIVLPSDITMLAEKLIRKIDLEGYSEIEFRRDVKGIPHLMEINPRLSMSVDIAVQSGIDFPLLVYQWANGYKINTAKKYTVGLWERYLAGDMVTTVQALQEAKKVSARFRILFDFFITFFQPMKYDYVDSSDMRPVWNATGDFMKRNAGKYINNEVLLKFKRPFVIPSAAIAKSRNLTATSK